MTSERFTGFGPEVHEFFLGLEEHNDREWFQAHRATYDAAVKAPLEALLAEVEPTTGPGKLFRLNRDVRFSHDKSPYKTQQGARIDQGGRGMLYLHVDADELMVGRGAPHLDAGQLLRYRTAVAGPAGEDLVALIAQLKRSSIVVGTLAEEGGITPEGDLKRVPKPWPADHPRAGLLRLKRLVGARSWERPSWLTSRTALRHVREAWDKMAPLADWLEEHVGPGTEERRR